MSIEENLKSIIIKNYGTLKNFATHTGIPYPTVHAILERGIENAGFMKVARICKVLEISAPDLAEGRIVPDAKENAPDLREIPVIIMYARLNPQDFPRYTLYGQPLTTAEGMMLLDALEIAVKIIKRWRDEK